MEVSDLINRLRILEIDHEPEGWPAIKMKDVSSCLDLIESEAAEITELRLQAISDSGELLTAFAERDKWKSLATCLYASLSVSAPLYREHDADWHEALTKYREIKGGDDVPDAKRT